MLVRRKSKWNRHLHNHFPPLDFSFPTCEISGFDQMISVASSSYEDLGLTRPTGQRIRGAYGWVFKAA